MTDGHWKYHKLWTATAGTNERGPQVVVAVRDGETMLEKYKLVEVDELSMASFSSMPKEVAFAFGSLSSVCKCGRCPPRAVIEQLSATCDYECVCI